MPTILKCIQFVSFMKWNCSSTSSLTSISLLCSDAVKHYIVGQCFCICVWTGSKHHQTAEVRRRESWSRHITLSQAVLLSQIACYSSSLWQSLRTQTPLKGIKINTDMWRRLLFEDVNNPCYTHTGRVSLHVAQTREGLDLQYNYASTGEYSLLCTAGAFMFNTWSYYVLLCVSVCFQNVNSNKKQCFCLVCKSQFSIH